jgi:hypothetical protein
MRARVMDADDEEQPGRLGLLVRGAATFYLGQIARAGGRDAVVSQWLFDVINLSVRPGALLFDPRIVARVVWARFRQLLAPPAANDQANARLSTRAVRGSLGVTTFPEAHSVTVSQIPATPRVRSGYSTGMPQATAPPQSWPTKIAWSMSRPRTPR